jgi:thioredoxin reductase (NADPH)
MENVIIIGTGAAGYTAAIYTARANLRPLMISGRLPGGQLTQTTDVENYPGFVNGVQGFDLMEAMKQQAIRFDCRIRSDIVTSVSFKNGGPQLIHLNNGETIESKAVIICTGASPRWLGLQSEEDLKNKGVSSCATCDGAFFRGVPICVIGGGDTAMEEAVFLTRFASKVIIVHRRDRFRASKIMADRAINNPKIEVSWNSVPVEFLDVKEGKVTGLVVKDVNTGEQNTMDCGAIFVAIGHIPSTEAFKDEIEMDEAGYIITDGVRTHTNVEGVFAGGDCVDTIYRQAVTAAGMGCRAAIDAERWLESQR